MSSKKKEIVWHKKKAKFIPPTLTKPHSAKKEEEASQGKQDRRRKFVQDFAAQIKKAVHKKNDD